MTKPVIVTRAGKGSALTITEGDSNFTNLQNATVAIKAGTGGTNVVSDLNGTVTLVAGSNITITGDNTAKTLTINSGAIASANLNYVQSAGGTSLTVTTGETFPYSIASVTITTTGGPVLINSYGDATNLIGASTGEVQLYRGTSTLGSKVLVGGVGVAAQENSAFALNYIDNPTAGTYTYHLKVNTLTGGNYLFGQLSAPIINVVELQGIQGDTGPSGGATTLDGLTDVVITSAASGEVLYHNGTNWVDTALSTLTAGNATYASAVTLTADNTTNATNYPLFANAATGNLSPRTDTGFSYNPSTGILTATSFAGAHNGTVGATTPSTGVFTTITAQGTTNTAKLVLDATAVSSTSWTTAGIGIKALASTYTNTTSTGTIASSYIHSLQTPTVVSTSVTTITDAATLYVAQPNASTNTTMTQKWSIWAEGGIRMNNMNCNGPVFIAPSNSNVTITPSGTSVVAISSGAAGTINNMSIGVTTPLAGAFTTLSASSTVSGTGFSTYLASPPAIGATTSNTGDFTTLTVDGGNDLRLSNTANTFYVGFKAGTLTASKIWTLPVADGTTGQVLSTNGAGALSWATAGGSSGNNIILLSVAARYITFPTGANADMTDSWVLSSTGGVSGVSVSTNTFTLPAGTYLFRLPQFMNADNAFNSDFRLRDLTASLNTATFAAGTMTIGGVARGVWWPSAVKLILASTKTFTLRNGSNDPTGTWYLAAGQGTNNFLVEIDKIA